MAVLHGEQQRTRASANWLIQRGVCRSALAPLKRRVRRNSGLEKRAHHIHAAFAHGKEEWGESRFDCRVDVGAGLDERADDGIVAFGRSPHQRRLPAPLAHVVFGAVDEERFHRLDVPGAGSQHQNGFAALHRGVRIRAGRQQQLDDAGAAVGARHRKRRHAVAVQRVDVGAGSYQQRSRRRIILIRGPVQGRRSVDLSGVHIDARLEKRAHARRVASLDGVCERRAFGGQSQPGDAEHQENKSAQSSAMHVRLPQVTYSVTGSKRSSTFPLLSPNESRWMPTRSSSVR